MLAADQDGTEVHIVANGSGVHIRYQFISSLREIENEKCINYDQKSIIKFITIYNNVRMKATTGTLFKLIISLFHNFIQNNTILRMKATTDTFFKVHNQFF